MVLLRLSGAPGRPRPGAAFTSSPEEFTFFILGGPPRCALRPPAPPAGGTGPGPARTGALRAGIPGRGGSRLAAPWRPPPAEAPAHTRHPRGAPANAARLVPAQQRAPPVRTGDSREGSAGSGAGPPRDGWGRASRRPTARSPGRGPGGGPGGPGAGGLRRRRARRRGTLPGPAALERKMPPLPITRATPLRSLPRCTQKRPAGVTSSSRVPAWRSRARATAPAARWASRVRWSGSAERSPGWAA